MTTNNEMCPVCSEGKLISQVHEREINHLGHTGKINQYFSKCDFCKSEITGQEESLNNLRAVSEFRKNT